MSSEKFDMNEINKIAREASDAYDAEKLSELSTEDKLLDQAAREIIVLERDMNIPGKASSDSQRVERLMQFIESRDF